MRDPNAAPRYGEALLNVAEKEHAVEPVLEGIRLVRETVRGQPGLIDILDVPQISPVRKKALLRRAYEGNVHTVLLNFLLLLVDRRRGEALLEMFDAFEDALDRRRGIHPVEIRTAVPFPEDLKPRLVEKLQAFCQGPVRVNYIHDPTVIGGVLVLRLDTGTDIDGTLRRGLELLQERLLKTVVH